MTRLAGKELDRDNIWRNGASREHISDPFL